MLSIDPASNDTRRRVLIVVLAGGACLLETSNFPWKSLPRSTHPAGVRKPKPAYVPLNKRINPPRAFLCESYLSSLLIAAIPCLASFRIIIRNRDARE